MDLSTGGFHYGSIGVGSNSSQHLSETMPIVQVGHQISDETATPISSEKQKFTDESKIQPITISETGTSVPFSKTKTATTEELGEKVIIKEEVPLSQGLTSASERYGSLHPLVFFCCFFTVSALLVFSFRLLKNDQMIS
jgi:hypothetical protein